jgi:hypothetical protein
MTISRIFATTLLAMIWVSCCTAAIASTPRFEISFAPAVRQGAVTGRLLLMISRANDPEVRLQAGWIDSPPMFGVDVSQLLHGQPVVIDGTVAGFPLNGLRDIPPGDYYVQALLNVYTEFHRADGHVIWAHMDQWEGQKFNQSPGNLISKVQKIHLDASKGYSIRLSLSEIIPPVQIPVDTRWVKHIRIQSKLLTDFWGHPMYLGAVVLLPRDYDSSGENEYPVIYEQGHFSHSAPFEFQTDNAPEDLNTRKIRENLGVESGYQFFQAWNSDRFPRMIAVTFLHPTPYYDASYAVNSANTGPYGDALMTELIPYLEQHFRIIRQPYARVLTGGSTGGWEALALELQHPDFFGGVWALYPDPVDFRRYDLVNIYDDQNSFVFDSSLGTGPLRQSWLRSERPMIQSDDGQPIATVREVSRLESVLGTKGRSGEFLENWEAVWGPMGEDGYPVPLWDKLTGTIDHSVAAYMRDHGYDLSHYAKANWPRIGPKLLGKLHVYCGDMDNFYLNLGVYLFQQVLVESKDPHYAGTFEYGRPMKGHGWQPVTNAELVRVMAEQIARNTPRGAYTAWLH